MNKLFTKVVGVALGLTMAVGVGVAVAAGVKETVPVYAAEGATHDMSITQQTSLNNLATIPSINIPAQSYTVAKITMVVRYNKTAGGATATATIGTTNLGSKTHNANSTVTWEWTVDPAQQAAISIDFVNNCATGTGKGTFYVNSVTLTEGPAPHVDVTSVTVDPSSTTLLPGGTYDLASHVTVLPNNATDPSVTYEVTDADPAGCATVSSAGLITAVEDGIAEITVTSVDNDAKSDTFMVEIETPSEPTISLNESSLEGFVGGSSSLTATFVALEGTGVTWSQTSSDGGSVTLGTPDVSVSGKSTVSVAYSTAGTITIKAQDNGGSTYAECSVVVSKTLTGAIYAQTITDENSVMNFTAKCNGEGTAADGAEWTITSDGDESNFDSTSGIHYGTNSAYVTYIELTTSGVSGTIKSVVVNARDAQSTATVSVTVGGVAFTCSGSTTATNTSSDFTFTGSRSGSVVVRVDRGSSMQKALYVKTVTVTYEKITTGADIKNTNVLAQKAVIEFAEDLTSKLNAVCDQVNGNTDVEELDAKWSLISGTFTSKRSSLDASHQTAFDQLIKFASKSESGDALQKALSSYDYVYAKYHASLTAGDFLNSGSGRGAVQYSAYIGPFESLMQSTSSTVTIVVIVSMVSLTAIGGYFFLRKRKEQ